MHSGMKYGAQWQVKLIHCSVQNGHENEALLLMTIVTSAILYLPRQHFQCSVVGNKGLIIIITDVKMTNIL